MKNIKFLPITLVVCLIFGFTVNLNAQQILGGSSSYLSYDTSYRAGYDAGSLAVSQDAEYDDTVPFICDASYDPTAYKNGYKDGYSGSPAQSKGSKFDPSIDDEQGYYTGYEHGLLGTGYCNTPPDTYITQDSKEKYMDSYHRGYFHGINDTDLAKAGKFTESNKVAGAVVNTLEDGTVFTTLADGSTICQNGDYQIITKPDGSIVHGWVVSDDKKGNTVWKYSNGTTVYTYSDGSYFSVDSKNWTYYNANTKCQMWSNGQWQIYDTDGNLISN